METQVNELHAPGLLVTMLMMRRHEKDFILRRDRKYGDEMKVRADEFTAGIASADIPDTAKAELTRKLADYQRTFFAWMETALKLSADLKAMSESFAVVEPALEVISTEVHGLKDAADRSMMALRDKVKQEMVFSILLIAGAVLTMGYFIGRSVSKPLTAMTAAMMDLANGNFSIVLPGLGRADEVGEIAQAVETFKLRAEQKAREEAESRIKQDQIAAEQRKQDMIRLADTFESAVGEIV
jgi:methyl-accepting chemotaxis protein